mgnify:CR=1 FL=1
MKAREKQSRFGPLLEELRLASLDTEHSVATLTETCAELERLLRTCKQRAEEMEMEEMAGNEAAAAVSSKRCHLYFLFT